MCTRKLFYIHWLALPANVYNRGKVRMSEQEGGGGGGGGGEMRMSEESISLGGNETADAEIEEDQWIDGQSPAVHCQVVVEKSQ